MIISEGKGLNFAPQALAERMPITNATGYFYGQVGETLGDLYQSYAAMYRFQPALATMVDKISASAARLSFCTWKQTDQGRVEDNKSAWAALWRQPCPLMSRFHFWRWTFSTYELYGEAFWLKIRNGADVVGLYPMHPSRVAVQRDINGDVLYVFTLGVASAGVLKVPASEVVPFLRYNPDDIMRGLSRVEPLRTTLENEQQSRRSVSSAWLRGAQPSMMLSTDAKLSDQAFDRLEKQITQRHGGPDRAGGTLLLEEGMKPYPIQLNPVEMQYIQSRQLDLQEVCMTYDVPPPVVHILDHATFSNITEQMRSMYRDTMAPRLEDVESAVEHHLLPDFDPTGQLLSGAFALDEVLRGDFETRATAVMQLIQTGVMTPDEARTLFDLPQIGGRAAQLYANAALQPLGRPAERISLTETGVANPAQQELIDQTQEEGQQNDDAAAAGKTLGLLRVAGVDYGKEAAK